MEHPIIHNGATKSKEAETVSADFKSRAERIIRNFTPSWFTVSMGTGMIAILLYKLPYNGAWLYWISVVIFLADLILFLLFSTISAIRYIFYPEIWNAMTRHPVESLFLGTWPMTLGIIIEMMVFVCVPAWGPWVVILIWTLWWIEVVTSVLSCLYLPYIIITVHKSEITTMTTLWLLPIVSTVVCAATGGMVAEVLPNPAHGLWTLVVSYVLWGIGIPLAIFILILYYHRITMHKLPPAEVIASVFLPLGPLGEGGFGIMKMGQVSRTIFLQTHTLIPSAGDFFYLFGFLTALLMWGFALTWLSWAVASFVSSKPSFNMGWWGIVFATGVFTGSTITLGQEMSSRFFDVLGTVFTVIIVIFWIVISFYTIQGTISGKLFLSPAVAELELAEETSSIDL